MCGWLLELRVGCGPVLYLRLVRFLRLIRDILKSCGGGLAIGYYICQWLANFYLEPLGRMLCGLPGVKYYTRHMDNLTLLGPNKRLLHRARAATERFMREQLGVRLKGNWQVYRTTLSRAAAARASRLDDRRKALRRPRAVATVGYRFWHNHVGLCRRNFLRTIRQARRIRKKQAVKAHISTQQAQGFISRIGQLNHCNSFTVRQKYIFPIKINALKEVTQNESKRRQRPVRCI